MNLMCMQGLLAIAKSDWGSGVVIFSKLYDLLTVIPDEQVPNAVLPSLDDVMTETVPTVIQTPWTKPSLSTVVSNYAICLLWTGDVTKCISIIERCLLTNASDVCILCMHVMSC